MYRASLVVRTHISVGFVARTNERQCIELSSGEIGKDSFRSQIEAKSKRIFLGYMPIM